MYTFLNDVSMFTGVTSPYFIFSPTSHLTNEDEKAFCESVRSSHSYAHPGYCGIVVIMHTFGIRSGLQSCPTSVGRLVSTQIITSAISTGVNFLHDCKDAAEGFVADSGVALDDILLYI